MLLTVLMGSAFILFGLSSVWVGIRWAQLGRRTVSEQRMSPLEVWLWVVSFITAGLGFFCMGVTGLRYSRGGNIEVPANAPLIDQAVWGLGIGGMIGAFVFFSGGLSFTLSVKSALSEMNPAKPDGHSLQDLFGAAYAGT